MAKQKKRRLKAYFLILNLFISIVAISFMMSNVSAENTIEGVKFDDEVEGEGITEYFFKGKKVAELDTETNQLTIKDYGVKNPKIQNPGSSTTPTKWKPEGKFRGGIEEAFGGGSTAPAGTKLVTNADGDILKLKPGETTPPEGYEWLDPETAAAGASGVGFTLSGIAEGFLWATAAMFFLQTLVGAFSDDEKLASSLGKAAFGGIATWKTFSSTFGKGGVWQDALGGSPLSSTWSVGLGTITAVSIFLATYRR